MKHNQADKPKIIVLSLVLLAILLYIGVRSVQLSREWKGKADTSQHQHAAHAATVASTPGVDPATGEPPSIIESNPRLSQP